MADVHDASRRRRKLTVTLIDRPGHGQQRLKCVTAGQTRSWKTVYQGYVPTTAPSAVTASSV